MVNRYAFSLVEMLITLLVISIVIMIALPMSLDAVKHTRATRITTNMRTLEQSSIQYIITEKTYELLDVALLNSLNYFDESFDENSYLLSITDHETDSSMLLITVKASPTGLEHIISDIFKQRNVSTDPNGQYVSISTSFPKMN